MEAINDSNFLDEEWETLSKMFSSEDIFEPFNRSIIFSNGESSPTSGENVATEFSHEVLGFLSDNTFDSNNFLNLSNISQENSNSNDLEGFGSFSYEGIDPYNKNISNYESMNFYTMDCQNIDHSMVLPIFSDGMMEEILQLNEEILSNERLKGNEDHIVDNYTNYCEEMQSIEANKSVENENASESSMKKRPRTSKDAQKNKRASQSKRKKKIVVENSGINGEEEKRNDGENEHILESNDDSNYASKLELMNEERSTISESKASSGVSQNSNGKVKASRGSATDPQSLYARKRRERINERLRILQSLVPNGTKVDISTMLEEAVHYVKFLQLQIKLLSSDDLWMFAPIAYNGVDIGLYQKIVPNRWF